MSNFLKYKGYLGTVEYSEEDNLLHGKAAGIRDLVSYDGESLKSLKINFEEAIDDYLEICKAEGLEPDKTTNEDLQKMIRNNMEELLKNSAAI
ncbi:MAG: type II toxin-antitoxin system HicB family antitoxin [Defluviitaleaceae bacterium]|nr:type II toxin-antitoxin system HicB family antitoxin [Defluviitaleaceae bacterium]